MHHVITDAAFRSLARADRPPSRSQALAAFCAVAALLSASTGARAAPQLQLDATTSSVAVGQAFDVVLTGHAFDLTAGGQVINNVTGGQNLNFSFSNTTFQLLSVTIDPRWTFSAANKPGTIDQALGTIAGTAFGVFPATTDDDFTIATFSIKALAPGMGTLTLLSGQIIGQVAGQAGQLIVASTGTATIGISPVPESAPWVLLAAGVCMLGLRTGRRR